MSLPAISRVPVLRGGPAWPDTGLRYCLTAVCAGSAGVHTALIQPHLAESRLLGLAFAAAAAALVLAALVVRQPRHDSWAIAVATATLCVIAVSYLFSRSTGIPLLIVQPEQVDPLGTVTTAAELAGAVCGAALISRKDRK
jgi:ABC-type Fe3+-siderophore transport system permease subunit